MCRNDRHNKNASQIVPLEVYVKGKGAWVIIKQ